MVMSSCESLYDRVCGVAAASLLARASCADWASWRCCDLDLDLIAVFELLESLSQCAHDTIQIVLNVIGSELKAHRRE